MQDHEVRLLTSAATKMQDREIRLLTSAATGTGQRRDPHQLAGIMGEVVGKVRGPLRLLKMKLLGLTGGMGMGKTTVGRLLSNLGANVIDTDVLARRVVEPGQPAREEVQREFGPEVLGPDGRLKRDELARRVFSDPSLREKLEAILHPRIRQAWLAQVDQWRSEGRQVGVVVIPLLFETGAAQQFDAVAGVACSERSQMERLHARGWSDLEIQNRLRAQCPIEKKIAKSHFVVWTEGPLSVTTDQLKRILDNL